MASKNITITDYRKLPGQLSEDNTVYCFPQIDSVNTATKRVTLWRIIVGLYNKQMESIPIDDKYFDNKKMPVDIVAYHRVISGVEGGKDRDSDITIISKGKNFGRSNETNVFCQALRDALSLHNKQAKKSSTGQQQTTQITLYPPMLATKLEDFNSTIDYPNVYLQRKYNGVRVVTTLDNCIDTNNEIQYKTVMYSRSRSLYPGFQHIKQELFPALMHEMQVNGKNIYLDGEIYKHGETLQTISGMARREKKAAEILLDYYVYDCFIPEEPNLKYTERKQILDTFFARNNFQYVKTVETFQVHNKDEINNLYQQFLGEKYEGAMLRRDVPYKYSYNSYHSNHLLKIKPLLDSEFKLVDFTAATKGKAKGALMLIFETEQGKRFNVTPKKELDERKRLFTEFSKKVDNNITMFERDYKDKMVTIEYAELSVDGVPQQPRTDMVVRDYE